MVFKCYGNLGLAQFSFEQPAHGGKPPNTQVRVFQPLICEVKNNQLKKETFSFRLMSLAHNHLLGK